MDRLRGERGQASPEWLGVVLLVSLVFAGMVAAGVAVPGSDLARALVGKLKCAVSLGEGCGGEPSALVLEYGPEVAALVADRVPVLSYEKGMLSLPIDYRECREVGMRPGSRIWADSRVACRRAGHPVYPRHRLPGSPGARAFDG